MGLILEQMFRFGKGWEGPKIWIRQLPAAAECLFSLPFKTEQPAASGTGGGSYG